MAAARPLAPQPEPPPSALGPDLVGPGPPLLRVAQIWRGEMMAEQLYPSPKKVRLGAVKRCDFTIPALPEFPKGYVMFRPSKGGYVLTLGEGMTGKLSLGGVTKGVAEFLSAGGEAVGRADGSAGRFRALPVAPGDWGIVNLDGRSDHTFFFQFTRPGPTVPRGTGRRPEDELVAPSALFSFFLHGILLAITWIFLRFVPAALDLHGGRDSVTSYVVLRPPVEEPAPPPEKTPEPQAGTADGEKGAPPASSSGDEGKMGGEGDKPRARTKEPGDPAPSSRDAIVRAVQNKGILRERDKLAAVIGVGSMDDRLGSAVSRLKADREMAGGAGYGDGRGTGVGAGVGTGTLRHSSGNGPGGGGTAHADFVTNGAIKTGGSRPPKGVSGGTGVSEVAVKVTTGQPDGDFGGLTEEQVLKVVRAKQAAFRYCFEKELQRSPNMTGKIVINWRIEASGPVATGRVKSSSLGNAAVEDCVLRTVKGLRFPQAANGQQTVVNFPFIFARQ